ncbi:MAG: hypothetical protein ACOCXA_00075 [Planctomycetota bacterium]
MDDLTRIWHAAVTFPTVLYTGVLIVCLFYWGLVILGALDIDLFSPDTGEVDVGGEAGADADVDIEGGPEVSHQGGLVGNLAEALGVGTLPITIPLSLIAFNGWVIGMLAQLLLVPHLTGMLPALLIALLLFVALFVSAVLLSSVLARPLKPLFKTHAAQRGRAHLIGRRVLITSGEVGPDIGSARLEMGGGSELLLNVRDGQTGRLHRNQEAVIVDYDETSDCYRVAPTD